ncbi:MAG: helix-turn-helix transcriptional regulator [Pelotomaculum sp.]|nr:helix-turn-helix transcriptional regulator [Pelotomaculum sp.]
MDIRKLRQQKNISRAELSRRTGIDYVTLYKLKRGLMLPFPGWRRRIAQALGVEENKLPRGDGK